MLFLNYISGGVICSVDFLIKTENGLSFHPFPGLSCLCHPKAVHLGQIVQHGYQLSLAVDLLLALQGESFDADGVIDMTEDRLNYAQVHAENVAA